MIILIIIFIIVTISGIDWFLVAVFLTSPLFHNVARDDFCTGNFVDDQTGYGRECQFTILALEQTSFLLLL